MFYVKRIPETEIQILGTVESLRQEKRSPVTNSPFLDKSVTETEKPIPPEKTSEGNVEESKRDVSLEELLTDDSKKREKRKNKDKKSVQEKSRIKATVPARKKEVHSRSTGKQTGVSRVLALSILKRGTGLTINWYVWLKYCFQRRSAWVFIGKRKFD